MSFPASLPSYTNPAGTTLVAGVHAAMHTAENNDLMGMGTNLGTNSGTFVLKNFTAGDMALRIRSGTVVDAVSGGTFNTVILGSPTIGVVLDSAGSSIFRMSPASNAVNFLDISNAANGNRVNITVAAGGTNGGLSIAAGGTTGNILAAAALIPTAGSLTDAAGGTLTANAALGNQFYCVLGTAAGNRTVGTPVNIGTWQSLTYGFKTSGSANGTLVWPSGAFTFSQDLGTPTLGTGTAWHYFSWRYNSVESKWHFMGQVLNVI